MIDIQKSVKIVRHAMWKNSPAILTGLGITGFLSSITMAISAAPKAKALMEESLYDLYLADCVEEDIKNPLMIEHFLAESVLLEPDVSRRIAHLTLREKLEATWRLYLPSVTLAGVSATVIILASRINLSRNAALASLYAISEAALKTYQEKVVETIGEKKEELIRDSVAEDTIAKNPISKAQVVKTGFGEQICYETLSGRYFTSDIETLRQAQNNFNKRLLTEMHMTLNELYYEIGLPNIELGDKVGWAIDKHMMEFDFFAKLAEDNTPCVVVSYVNAPEALWF